MNLHISAPNHNTHFSFWMVAAIIALAGVLLALGLAWSPFQAVKASTGQPAAGQVLSAVPPASSPHFVAVPTPPQADRPQAPAAHLSATPVPGADQPVRQPVATPRPGQ